MGSFLRELCDTLPETPVSLMTSAGQLKGADEFRPIDSLLSGPAGGVAGALALARSVGLDQALTFDMGGTSTDVARITGEACYRYEQEIGPIRVLAPAVSIETVAAGGGSICQWRNDGLEVGPESAGSDPAGYVHDNAINTMSNIGIDISKAKSKLKWNPNTKIFDGTFYLNPNL